MPTVVQIVTPLVIFLVCGFTRQSTAITWTHIVKTTRGDVVGEILETVDKRMKYSSFKGIPYAKPPVGYLRFRPPVEKTPWRHVLPTIVEGSICPQIDLLYKTLGGSEDCLYLNVYTPEVEFSNNFKSNLKPVMFWIHGGSLTSGYANSSVYGPDFLIQEDIVLVTINYRLGALGFFNLEHENATGNAGIKDQNMALKWVKDNIINFGGNPNKVTIFGESAGSVSVDYHVLSSMSQGLFHQSISMSGSAMSPNGLQQPENAVMAAFALGAALGIRTTDKDVLLTQLYKKSSDDVVKASLKMTTMFFGFGIGLENKTLAPNEPKFLTECSKPKYTSGSFNRGPHMMGFLKHECNAFANAIDDLLETPISAFIDKKILDEYRKKKSPELLKIILDTLTEVVFITGIDWKQQLMNVKNDNPIFYYRISIDPKTSVHKYLYKVDLDGAAHADDILYLFNLEYLNITQISECDEQVVSTRKKMVTMWTNFAKYGNPTPCKGQACSPDLPTWLPSGPDGKYLDIGDKLVLFNKRPTNSRIETYQSLGIGIAGC